MCPEDCVCILHDFGFSGGTSCRPLLGMPLASVHKTNINKTNHSNLVSDIIQILWPCTPASTRHSFNSWVLPITHGSIQVLTRQRHEENMQRPTTMAFTSKQVGRRYVTRSTAIPQISENMSTHNWQHWTSQNQSIRETTLWGSSGANDFPSTSIRIGRGRITKR